MIVCAALVPPSAVASAQPVKSDQEVIIGLEKSWNESFYKKDVKFIASILAD